MNTAPDLKSVAGRWMTLNTDRTSHLNRCRLCAELTIPSILPPENYNHNTPLRTPFQGVGARCVTTLSAKTVLALFPPSTPFFRNKLDPMIELELKEQLGEENFKSQIEKGLADVERLVVDYIETIALRVHAYQIMRQLFVTGNVLIYGPLNGKTKIFRLDQFVCRRNPQGEVIEIVIKEGISKDAVPEEYRKSVADNTDGTTQTSANDTYDLYTHVKWVNGTYHYYQELNGKRVDKSDGTYPLDKPLFNVVSINLDTNADYGHGLVSEHLGDFTTLESLSQSIVEGTAAMAKIIFLVNPNGTTSAKDLISSPNCGFVSGLRDDVQVLQVEKFNDFQIPFQLMERIEMRLNHAFLTHTGVQRNAERVTASEIRFMAEELEDSLGGIYTVLSQNLQAPWIRTIMADMAKQSKIQFMPRGVNPVIITGMEALGRGHDLQKMQIFLEYARALLGDEMRFWIKKRNALDKISGAVQFNADEILNDENTVNAAMQQEQQQQMMMEMGKPAVGPIAGAMAQGMVQGGQQQ